MPSRDERLELNQATFRSANEGMIEAVNVRSRGETLRATVLSLVLAVRL